MRKFRKTQFLHAPIELGDDMALVRIGMELQLRLIDGDAPAGFPEERVLIYSGQELSMIITFGAGWRIFTYFSNRA